MQIKNWQVKPLPNEKEIEQLRLAINVNSVLAALLIQRGVNDFVKAKTFFRPSLDHLHNPFLMADMAKAVQRIDEALVKSEKIMVYGDYDVDGTTAVSLVYHFLKNHTTIKNENLSFYTPDRYGEGYGISFKGIDFAHSRGVSLMIALDCGIKANDKVKYAQSLGIDFIICDHHEPGEKLPEAIAVLDPKRNDCSYPYKELSGCGVGFKLIQAYSQIKGLDRNILYPYLDLLMLSIAADIVPITGENRVFCFHGLHILNTNARPGLKALGAAAGFKKDLLISNVVFGLAPRINAAGRIAHAHAAIDLLLSENEIEALKFAENLNENNFSRKDFDSQITSEALEWISKQENVEKLHATVVYNPTWHKGVIGIVASRCTEKFYRPTVVLTESNGIVAGSARSVEGFDLYEALSACSDCLEQFGGHTHAAGMTLKKENIDTFRAKFEEEVSKRITAEQLIPKVTIDMEVDFTFVSQKSYNILKQMSPFGPGNMTPVFLTKNIIDAGGSRIVGDNHLKLNIKQAGHQKIVDGIAFGKGEFLEKLLAQRPLDICYTLSENTFNNQTTIQLMVQEIRESE
jgi:single-stranded-DNA-specific exonuclease